MPFFAADERDSLVFDHVGFSECRFVGLKSRNIFVSIEYVLGV